MDKRQVLVVFLSIIGTIIISSAVVAFESIKSVGPFIKSAWRLQISTMCFFIQVLYTSRSKKISWKKSFKNYKQIIVSGLSIGFYFCLWTLSLDLTSVAHSLTFLCSCSLLIVIFYLVTCKRLKFLEIFGVLIGFSGMFVMNYFKNSSEEATWYGDLVALSGALSLTVNLIISENHVQKSIEMYLFLIHLIATLFSTVLAIVLEPSSAINIFGYLYMFDGIYAFYLGIVCGFIGNGIFYYLLNHVNPLIVSIILNFEPVLGTLFAWFFGFQQKPSMLTIIGGAVVIVGNIMATVSYKLKANEKNPKNYKAISTKEN